MTYQQLTYSMVIMFYFIGDCITTVIILNSPKYIELNPLIQEYGVVYLIIGKVVMMGVIIGYNRVSEQIKIDEHNVIPNSFNITIGVLGLYATINNSLIIL